MAVYINNLLIISLDTLGINKLKSTLAERFKIINLNPYSHYLKISII